MVHALVGTAGRTAGLAAGLGLGAVFGAVAALRRGRPLHPQGVTLRAGLRCDGSGRSGVPLLDDAGACEVTVRASRATGLPAWLPDVYGLALRLPRPSGGDGGPADVLFASTGDSGLGRFALLVHSQLTDGPLTTLLPVRSPAGPLLLRLAAVPGAPEREVGPSLRVPERLSLSYAVGTGPWVAVGEVALGEAVEGEGDPRRHDPVVHELPGTSQYPVVRALREPAYAAARHQQVEGGQTRVRGVTERHSTR